MADPISVRHVMASSEIAERIAKTAATTSTHQDDEFQKHLNRQEELKQSMVNNKDESKNVDNEDKEGRKRDQERKAKKAAEDDPNQDHGEVAASPSDHIIDLQV